jgi:hypothetical protein
MESRMSFERRFDLFRGEIGFCGSVSQKGSFLRMRRRVWDQRERPERRLGTKLHLARFCYGRQEAIAGL